MRRSSKPRAFGRRELRVRAKAARGLAAAAKACLGFLLPFTLATAASAADTPDIVRDEIRMAEQQCRADGGHPQQQRNFLRASDLNGDGGEDWVLDYRRFACRGAVPPRPYCGSGGCSLVIYLWSGDATWKRAFDETVQDYRFVKLRGRPALQVDFGGAVCGKVNAETCRRRYLLGRNGLVSAR